MLSRDLQDIASEKQATRTRLQNNVQSAGERTKNVYMYLFMFSKRTNGKVNLSERGKVVAKSYFCEYTLFYGSNFGTTTFIFIEF